ncbi:protein ALP1-like [Lycium barbarum]|uniref:protein ALP1-like n=1 Tax=Lycium barbarum TaxID=112863 RepID=UPI00293F5BAC|nr:protein ALP1-like [Lycium barbarum]
MATAGRKRGRKKKKKNKTLLTKKITKLTKKFKATLQLRHQHCTKLIPQLISAISSAHSFLVNHDLHLLPNQSLSLESLISNTSTSISNIVSLLNLPPPPPRAVPRADTPSPRAADCWFQRFLAVDSDTLLAESSNIANPDDPRAAPQPPRASDRGSQRFLKTDSDTILAETSNPANPSSARAAVASPRAGDFTSQPLLAADSDTLCAGTSNFTKPYNPRAVITYSRAANGRSQRFLKADSDTLLAETSNLTNPSSSRANLASPRAAVCASQPCVKDDSDTLLAETSNSTTPSSTRANLTHPRADPDSPRAADWGSQLFRAADLDSLWAENFNLTKTSFTLLLRLLTPSLSSLPVPPNYALAAALYRLAHGASFSAISRRFGIDSPSACRVFYTVCKAINENLGHLFELKSDINRVIVGFGWISLPNCCGVLGIEKFELDGDLMGENGFLLVQALVDSEGRFLDVSAGWPGSMKPENVLRKSKLYLGVEESKEYLNGPSFELNDGNSIPQYILGDSCFPLLPWVLTPYKGSNEEDGTEMAFNSVHRKGMQLVGTAFGRVREKWKLLAKKWNEQCLEAFPFVIVTCCLLHNFLIKCSEAVADETKDYPRNEEFLVFDGEVDESGKKTRDALASHLFRVSQRE